MRIEDFFKPVNDPRRIDLAWVRPMETLLIVRQCRSPYTLTMLKAIIFDFDGVIVDSEPLHYQAFLRVARGLGIEFDYAHYLDRYVGFDDRDGFRAMLADASGSKPQHPDDDQIALLCQEKALAFEAVVAEGFETIPGILGFIEQARLQMPIAIASGATKLDIDLILGRLNLTPYFHPIITADNVARSKPDPRTYTLAVDGLTDQHPDLAIKPPDCLAIEDTPAGIESARKAGLKTLGLTTTHGADRLNSAHRVVQTVNELTIEVLHQWFD